MDTPFNPQLESKFFAAPTEIRRAIYPQAEFISHSVRRDFGYHHACSVTKMAILTVSIGDQMMPIL